MNQAFYWLANHICRYTLLPPYASVKVIGAQTIAVATGKFSVEELAAHRPTTVFANFADTAAFLRVIER